MRGAGRIEIDLTRGKGKGWKSAIERAQRQHPSDVKENEIGEEEKNGERGRGRGRRKTVISSLSSSDPRPSTSAHKCIAIFARIFLGGTTERKERVIGTPT